MICPRCLVYKKYCEHKGVVTTSSLAAPSWAEKYLETHHWDSLVEYAEKQLKEYKKNKDPSCISGELMRLLRETRP